MSNTFLSNDAPRFLICNKRESVCFFFHFADITFDVMYKIRMIITHKKLSTSVIYVFLWILNSKFFGSIFNHRMWVIIY